MKAATDRNSMTRHYSNIEWLHNASIITIKNLPNNIDKQQATDEARKLFLADQLKKFEGKTITPALAEELSTLVLSGWQNAEGEVTSAYKMWATLNLYKDKIEVLKAVLEEYANRCCHSLVDSRTYDVGDGYNPVYQTSHRCRICNKSWDGE